MHLTPRGGASRRPFLALLALLAVLVLALAQAAPAFAATSYVGGPAAGDYPLYVPNDYTTCALRFSARGLLGLDDQPVTAPTQFYVKIRLSPIPGPNGANNRGFTWNDQTRQWLQEREDWSSFPTIMSDASGSIATSNRWFFFQFGDTTKSDTYYLIVSLQQVGAPADSGATQNSATMPPVTLMDMSGSIAGVASGFWVHNGIAIVSQANKRIEADAAGTADVWAVGRTEANFVDDDGNGTDDEDYGPSGFAADFRLGVPTGSAFDVKLQNVIWPSLATSFTGSLADVDVALGAVDTTPPSAPSLTVTAGNAQNVLSWGAATDATGVTGYQVFKWVGPVSGSGYTGRPQLVSTTAADVRTYTDDGITNGVAHHYIVRAVDAASNVGPRAEVTSTPKMPTTLTLAKPASVVPWNTEVPLNGNTVDADAAPVAQTVQLQSSLNGTSGWTTLADVEPNVAPYAHLFSKAVTPTRATYYRLSFGGTDVYGANVSAPYKITPKVKLGTPVAPKTVRKGLIFSVYGSLVPHQTPGRKDVKIKCYRKTSSGTWSLKKTVAATNTDYSACTRYKAKMSLPSAGSWKLVAFFPATSKYAATTSSARYVKVK